MAVIKEFRCFDHGEFEASHPICPAHGCDSKAVVREFRTPITIGSRMVKQHHAGLKRTAELMRLNNFRTAREGEAAYGGEAAKAAGTQVLWGDQSRRALGKSFSELMGAAAQPLTVRGHTLTRNNGMADAAESAGLTRRSVVPAAEVAVPRGEAKSEQKAKALVS